MSPPLVPEIRLRLATDAHGIFQALRDSGIDTGWPPYWAFAWPGGQALARYVLDNPARVAGKTVMDIGSGSGIAAIAAAMIGATSVAAADPDPLAAAAIEINARDNGVEIEILTDDVLGREPQADLILIADLVYEPELAVRVTCFLEAARARNAQIILADRTTARRPPLELSLLGEYQAPLTPLMEESHFEHARVWRLEPAKRSLASSHQTAR
jgi:predicted nicotinamide N-methyase